VEAGILADGVVQEREEGTPQGSPLSPLLGNVMLDERLDRGAARQSIRVMEERQRAISSAASPAGSCQLKAAPLCSSERSAFCSASGKLRPIAIASPTDFMCVVSTGSAPGNFSNVKRGTLTTT